VDLARRWTVDDAETNRGARGDRRRRRGDRESEREYNDQTRRQNRSPV
jgi:hypothetical protein